MLDRVLCGREIRAISSVLPTWIDQEAIARECGLPMPLREVSFDSCDENTSGAFWRAILKQSSDPTLPFQLGVALPFGTYEVIDYLTYACPTVGAALTKLERYFGLITPHYRWQFRVESLAVRAKLIAMNKEPETHFVFTQYILGAVFGRTRSAIEADAFRCVEVRLSLPRKLALTCYESFFGCPVRSEAEESEVLLERSTWDAALRSSEPGLCAILDAHAELILGQLRTSEDPLARFREAIRLELVHGPPSIKSVAKASATSTRTLQRRLREAGTSFQALVDQERAAAAKLYLGDPKLALGEVAYLLGYSELSAFARAFRRWMGQTPNAYRAAQASVQKGRRGAL